MSNIIGVRSTDEFFYEKLRDAKNDGLLDISDDTNSYVIGLLNEFTKTENFYDFKEENCSSSIPPVTVMRAQALNMPDMGRRVEKLEEVGRKCLFISGIFWKGEGSFKGLSTSIDHVITIGGASYFESATIVDAHHTFLQSKVLKLRIYKEIAYNFSDLVHALNEEIDVECMNELDTIIKLYESWMRTKSEIMRDKLRAKGIEPMSCLNN